MSTLAPDLSRPGRSVKGPARVSRAGFPRAFHYVRARYREDVRTVDWLTLLVALIAGILIPVLVLVARSARHGGVIEQKLDDLTGAEAEQDRRVAEIFGSLDRRLRWLEERIWGADPRYPRPGRRPPRQLPVSAGRVGRGRAAPDVLR